MKLKRDLVRTLLLQAGGGAATLLAALWIGRALGPAQQGQFNQLKSLVDLGAAVAALGMPQALYVYAQNGRIALPAARRLALRVALLGLPVGAGLAFWHHGWQAGAVAAALAGAVALSTLQAQWRALTLLGPATWRFNLVTVGPQLLLLPLAAGVVAAGGALAASVALALAAVWLAGCAQARWALAHTPALPVQGTPIPLRTLLPHGLATWATASFATLGVVLLQALAQRWAGAVGLGQFSLALLLVQLPLTPLNYAVPLLLRHRLTTTGSAQLRSRLPWVLGPMLALAGAVALLGAWRSDLGLGPGYAGLHTLLAILLLAGAAEAGMRLVAVDKQADGRPAHSAVAEGLRVLLLLVAVAAPVTPDLLTLAVAWAAASWAALALLTGWGRPAGARA
ncbi:membrane protein involved in the export of O-antigen and teichoic acid [Burkholderiales bacterium JOSHI_001]|nr:membrane protein involved in the export of O-antigen and teichoic acid [Burkholderiales bacterium JOSHI_001]